MVMTIFPFGQHDDDVDASSGAFNRLAAGRGGIFEAVHPSGDRRV
jgi:phage terminase large subunit-like protein